MSELIERQAAIDALDKRFDNIPMEQTAEILMLRKDLRELPTIQPEPCGDKSYTLWKESYEALKRRMDELTSCSDIISRHDAIDALNEYFSRIGKLKRRGLTKGEEAISLDTVGAIKTLPPARPEPHYDEWCDTCKEYDHERHCCPRWNHVIRTTLQDAHPEPHEGHWIWVAGDLECSKCHTRYPNLYPDYDNSVACPHCGAKMKGN